MNIILGYYHSTFAGSHSGIDGEVSFPTNFETEYAQDTLRTAKNHKSLFILFNLTVSSLKKELILTIFWSNFHEFIRALNINLLDKNNCRC